MTFSTKNNQINSFSKGFCQAMRDFYSLTEEQKIITDVDTFKAEKMPKGTNPTADKIDQLGQKILTEDNDQVIPEEKTTDVKNLSSEELLERCTGIPLQNNLLKSSSSDDDEVSEDQQEINNELVKRVSKMQESEQKGLLEQANANPEKFALVALGVSMNSRYVVSRTCKFLEQCEWPSQKLKEQFLPELVSLLILENGIAWDNWELGFVKTGESSNLLNVPGFCCHRILINTKKIFGHGDFTINPKPISPYLAKAIGLAIKQVADAHVLELKEKLEKGVDKKDDLRIGVEVVIGQFMETRFTASMIAPILPHLKNVPGMVSLELSDVGVRNPWDPISGKKSNGFNDDHAEDLLDIFRSQPYLQKTKINVDGMSEEKRKEFMSEWVKIWGNADRFQKPSPKELLSLTE